MTRIVHRAPPPWFWSRSDWTRIEQVAVAHLDARRRRGTFETEVGERANQAFINSSALELRQWAVLAGDRGREMRRNVARDVLNAAYRIQNRVQ
jgi:hypothetical protein